MASRMGFRLPRFERGGFAVLLAAGVATALLADQPLGRQLVLDTPALAREASWWRVVSAWLVFPEGHAGGILLTLGAQWFLGGPLERFWGTRRYLLLVLAGAMAGYLALALLAVSGLAPPVVAGGTTPVDLVTVTAFGVAMGRERVDLLGVLPMGARGLAVLIGVVTLLGPLARGEPWAAAVPGAVAVLVALLVTTQPWRKLGRSGSLGRRRRRRGHLEVVRDDPTRWN